MKILLINPFSALDKVVLAVTSDVPPLGLMDIGTQVLHKGHDVKILDASVNRYDINQIVSESIDYNPEVVGITALSSNYIFASKTALEIKKLKDIPVILGGVHATAMPSQCVESGIFDYVVSGEADESFPMLINAIEKNKTKDIPGVNYRCNDQTILNEPKRPEQLKNFQMRSWDLINIEKYKPSPASCSRLPAISTSFSRGCLNHSCIFCASRCVFGETYRSYSLEQIGQELEYFKRKGIKDIDFVDINFTSDRDQTIAVSNLLGKFAFKWNITTRCDYVDFDLLKIMKNNGCYQVGYGIEVGTQEELNIIGKNYTIEGIKKAVSDTIKSGILAKCFFTIGFPWQKTEDIQKTVEFAKELNPDMAIFSIVNPYPGTELFAKYPQKSNFDFRNMRHRSAEYSISEYFDEKQLIRFMNDANRQFYLRLNFALKFAFRHIRGIRTVRDFLNVFRGLRYLINK